MTSLVDGWWTPRRKPTTRNRTRSNPDADRPWFHIESPHAKATEGPLVGVFQGWKTTTGGYQITTIDGEEFKTLFDLRKFPGGAFRVGDRVRYYVDRADRQTYAYPYAVITDVSPSHADWKVRYVMSQLGFEPSAHSYRKSLEEGGLIVIETTGEERPMSLNEPIVMTMHGGSTVRRRSRDEVTLFLPSINALIVTMKKSVTQPGSR
jgi:hypothetical protein